MSTLQEMEAKYFVLPHLEDVVAACSTKKPKVPKTNPTEEQIKNLTTLIDTDFICKNLILHGLLMSCMIIIVPCLPQKKVWDALQKKYETKEARSKKYVVSKYLRYQMTNDRSVEVQSHEIQKIAHKIISESMKLDNQFQVAIIIDKTQNQGVLAWKPYHAFEDRGRDMKTW